MPSIDHLLIHRCTVNRNTDTAVGEGVFPETETPLARNVPTRIWARGGRERMEGEQQKTYASHIAYFRPTQDVKRNDVLTSVVREGRADPARYRVLMVTPPSKAHHLRVELEEIQLGA